MLRFKHGEIVKGDRTMLVLEKEFGDVVAMTHHGLESRNSTVDTNYGRYLLAIDATVDTELADITTETELTNREKLLRDNYRQELLMF